MPENPNIREYYINSSSDFIPGIPQKFPAGSRVTVNEDTGQIVNIWPQTFLASFAERLEADAEVNQVTPEQSDQTEPTPPALPG